MMSFISIIKLDNGVASYRIVERTDNDYTAYLVRNASSLSLPEEVNIDTQKDWQTDGNGNLVVDKLLTAIKSNSFMDDDPA